MIPIPVFSCKMKITNLLTTYIVECFDEENALCQIKTNVSVKFSLVCCFISIKIIFIWGCKYKLEDDVDDKACLLIKVKSCINHQFLILIRCLIFV